MWCITRDFIDDGYSVGVCSPDCAINFNKKTLSSKISEIEAEMPFRFRMLDDDDELYYIGYSSDNETINAFDALDDFGIPNAGCTEIQYFNQNNGQWEVL